MMKHYEVVAAVIEHDGKILCMQRNKGKFDYVSYKFEFPGGKVEAGEERHTALERELREEMDMDISGQVIENAPEKPVDDYADNDATEDVSDSGDIIADMGNFTITDNPDGDLNDPDNM